MRTDPEDLDLYLVGVEERDLLEFSPVVEGAADRRGAVTLGPVGTVGKV